MPDLHNISSADALEPQAAHLKRLLLRVRALLWATRIMQVITALAAAGLAVILVKAHGEGELLRAVLTLVFTGGPALTTAIRRPGRRRQRQPWRWTPLAAGAALLQGIGLVLALTGFAETATAGCAGPVSLLPALAVIPSAAACGIIKRLTIQDQCRLPLDLRFKLRRNEPVPDFAPDARWLSSARSILTSDALVVQVPRGLAGGVQSIVPITLIDKIETRHSRPADSPWLHLEDGHGLDVIGDVEVLILSLSTGTPVVIPAFDPPLLGAALEARREATADRSHERDG